MRHRYPAAFCLALSLVLAASSCATAGKGTGMPDWAYETPRPDSTNTYFVGQSSLGGPVGEALDDAAANLVASVFQYLGVSVSVDTSAEAKATLDSYRADMVQTVKTEAEGRLAGFQVRARYVDLDRKSGRRTVYILASYVTADLEREKARIASLFKEREDAVAKPEAEAKSLALAGRAEDALLSYLQAAMAATGPGIENPDAKLSRNLAAARALAGRMRFIVNPGLTRVEAGKPFPEPFVARLVVDDGTGNPGGVAGAKLLVSYARRQGTRTVSKTESAATDARGLLSFTPPPPDFVGPARFQVRLDIQPALDLLAGLPASRAAEAAALESILRSIAAEIPYESLSAARSVPTAVLVSDSDELGRPLAEAIGQSALAEALSKAGFALVPAGFGLEGLAGDDAVLASGRLAAQSSAYQRLAWGRSVVTGLRKDGAMWIADARAQVKVVDLASGAVLYSGEKSVSGLGQDEATARRAALREAWATGLAPDLLASLR